MELVPITEFTVIWEVCKFCGAGPKRPCVGAKRMQVHRVRLVSERRVVNLCESGCILQGYDPVTDILEVVGIDGNLEHWGTPVGRGYAIRFQNREFEFIRSLKKPGVRRKRDAA